MFRTMKIHGRMTGRPTKTWYVNFIIVLHLVAYRRLCIVGFPLFTISADTLLPTLNDVTNLLERAFLVLLRTNANALTIVIQ